MKKVIDMCPFMGLTWEDESGNKFYKGEGLSTEEGDRLDNYFKPYFGKAFIRSKAIQLAQMALNNEPIPGNFTTHIDEEL